MAKIRIKNLKKVTSNIEKRLTKFGTDAVEMKKVGKIISSELVTNWRNGLGGNDKPFPTLATSTIKRRKVLSAYNRTDQKYRPSLANVTFTGEFARSRRITFIGKATFSVKFVGSHKPYSLVRGGKSKAVTNDVISEGLTDLGYQLGGVPKEASKRILKQFRRYIRRNN